MAIQKTASPHYKGDIVAGSLLVRESRQVAGLMIQGFEGRPLKHKILEDNLLQKRSPVTAQRQARLIVARLTLLDPSFWNIIRDGSQEQATQAVLCATIKHNRLVGDFIHQVVTTQIRTFQPDIAYRDWDHFIEQCRTVDSSLDSWSESTRAKVRQVVFRILAEAKIIDSSRSKHLLPFTLLPEIRSILETHQETYVLHCLEIFQ